LTNLDLINKFIGVDNIGTPIVDEDNKIQYPIAGVDVPNYFRDITEYADGRTTYPYLSGNVFIDNPSTSPISEFEIKQIMDNYYPNLHIFAAHVTPAYTLKMVEVTTDIETGLNKTIELQTVKYEPSSTIYANAKDITVMPSRLHHDFKGWSLSENGDILTEVEINSLMFSESTTIYTLYAQFEWHEYEATFFNGTE
jgi:hypothetical protein